ncbi:cardiolipin synthase [Antarcticimicrobium luteum]|uniref:Cardiolipin synthase n=1 Tax=Antarcticimicrobium luteum TaxID=2547397 RepID=A0A4R5V007_9RHOB|nr:cardiolipin synthase [Antarcticimicrobium luteum]TDK45050.1 cardiolipin synthase [Antarcticimicrobium luteum]
MWVMMGSVAVAALYLVSVLFAFRAAATARTAQGSVGWVVFLLALPFAAVPAYLFLGHHRLRGYIISRREARQVVEALRDFAARNAPDPERTRVNLAPFEYCANMPAISGNGAELLIDGAAAFDAMFAAIDAAHSYVLVQFYIIRNDALGRAFQDRLIAAAARGVRVRVMTDAVGSFGLPSRYFARLRAAGVDVAHRKRSRAPRFRFQINYRNHRKSLIVDGETGFTGGFNVGDEYMGRKPAYGAWRDTHVRLRGPVVSQLQLIFLEDWHWITGDANGDMTDASPFADLNWNAPPDRADATGLIVATGPGDETETGGLLFFSAIAAAKKRVWIASPYFVPDTDIVSALRHAALRGVDVRLLVPERSDHWMPWLAAWAYFDGITEAGVRVFRYTSGFMHQKAFVVDDTIAAVGTTNLDNRSFRLNFEAMALFFDADFAGRVDAMLRADLENSYQMTAGIAEQSPFVRYGAPVARLFSPLL